MSLQQLFNHLALPPKLPGEQDAEIEDLNALVLKRLIKATATLQALPGHEYATKLDSVRRTLRRCEYLHSQGRLEKKSLVEWFQKLDHDQPLTLYIVEQNAGLIIRRTRRSVLHLISNNIHFETK